jgi:hypothetical protein
MLDFVAKNFIQVKDENFFTLTLIWSRTSSMLPMGEIRIDELVKRLPGFPYGLILEHSFVQIDRDKVFQKPDPKPTSKIEIIPLAKAIEPYIGIKGFELTHHIPKVQF